MCARVFRQPIRDIEGLKLVFRFTGMRAVFEAHGDIFTVPAKESTTRDITSTSGVMERQPAWSPDGQSIAYFSDESGPYS